MYRSKQVSAGSKQTMQCHTHTTASLRSADDKTSSSTTLARATNPSYVERRTARPQKIRRGQLTITQTSPDEKSLEARRAN